jgi:hypothetical protein
MLCQHAHMRRDVKPEVSPLYKDKAALDFWGRVVNR